MNTLPNTMRADDLLVETLNRLFEEHSTPERIAAAETSMDADLWTAAYDMGLTVIGVPEALGGAGGSIHDAAAVMIATGYHAVAAPVADSLAASLIAAAHGLRVSEQPLIAIAGRKVPWLPKAHQVLLGSAESGPQIVPTGEVPQVSVGTNYAGEPYAVTDGLLAVDHASDFLALARSLQIAGALQRVSELCVQYAMEREQFGKPIGKQQILQHYLAQMAGDAATAQAAADNAVDVLSIDGPGVTFHRSVAAAKTVVSRLVGPTNKNAHQLHGAIGYTDEHRLQLWTRRLWAWRDDFGTESQWGAELGADVLRGGGGALWPFVTSLPAASRQVV
jgi:acyl-CoA dehydrogenase